MAAVGVMQVPTDEIVDMVSVRHGLVAAARPVPVALVVSRAGVVGGTGAGVAVVHLEHMLLDVVAVRVMEMTVVQVVDVIPVLNRGMAAGWAVMVRMVRVDLVVMRSHEISFFRDRIFNTHSPDILSFFRVAGNPWSAGTVFPALLPRSPPKMTPDPSIWLFFSPFRRTPPVVMTHPPRSVLRWGRLSSQPVDQPQYFLEQFPRHRDLSQLEDGIAGVAHDLGADLLRFMAL